MNILVFEFKVSYILQDVAEAFKKCGHQIVFLKEPLEQSCYENESIQKRIEMHIRKERFDMVFSVNYYPVAAKACYEQQIVYAAWQYDSPPNLPLNETLDFPTNRVFFFSKYDAEYYSGKGLEHMYYLPLATNTKRFQAVSPDIARYGADISLIGKLYSSALPELMSIMTDNQKDKTDQCIKAQLMQHGCNQIDELLTDDFVGDICAHYKSLSEQAVQPSRAELFYACSTQVTYLERIMLLRIGAKIGRTALYGPTPGDAERAALADVEIRSEVDYLTQMPAVFKSTKINLNPTLRANRTAIPLRALDIMACNAFMLTSAQEEYEDFFMRDKEYVCYENLEEAVDKMRFYLAHESERQRIATAAFEKVQKHFTYEDRIRQIVATI